VLACKATTLTDIRLRALGLKAFGAGAAATPN
jgi:hypothetical protein